MPLKLLHGRWVALFSLYHGSLILKLSKGLTRVFFPPLTASIVSIGYSDNFYSLLGVFLPLEGSLLLWWASWTYLTIYSAILQLFFIGEPFYHILMLDAIIRIIVVILWKWHYLNFSAQEDSLIKYEIWTPVSLNSVFTYSFQIPLSCYLWECTRWNWTLRRVLLLLFYGHCLSRVLG